MVKVVWWSNLFSKAWKPVDGADSDSSAEESGSRPKSFKRELVHPEELVKESSFMSVVAALLAGIATEFYVSGAPDGANEIQRHIMSVSLCVSFVASTLACLLFVMYIFYLARKQLNARDFFDFRMASTWPAYILFFIALSALMIGETVYSVSSNALRGWLCFAACQFILTVIFFCGIYVFRREIQGTERLSKNSRLLEDLKGVYDQLDIYYREEKGGDVFAMKRGEFIDRYTSEMGKHIAEKAFDAWIDSKVKALV